MIIFFCVSQKKESRKCLVQHDLRDSNQNGKFSILRKKSRNWEK